MSILHTFLMNCNGSYLDGIIGARTEISIACIQRGVKNTSKIEFSRVFVLPQDMKSCKRQRAKNILSVTSGFARFNFEHI